MTIESAADIHEQLRAGVDPAEGISPAQARTRNRILAAAADHFARFGYRRANMADIAAEAGVGKGTVYLYFDSKVALLVTCITQEKLRLVPELEAALAKPPSERLEAYLRMTIDFAVTAPLSNAILKGDRELAAAHADAEAEGIDNDPALGITFVAGLVADAAPGLPTDDCERLAQVLISVASLSAHLQDLFHLSTDDFISTYARLLALGAAGHKPPTETS